MRVLYLHDVYAGISPPSLAPKRTLILSPGNDSQSFFYERACFRDSRENTPRRVLRKTREQLTTPSTHAICVLALRKRGGGVWHFCRHSCGHIPNRYA